MFYEFKHPLRADYFRVESGENFSFPAHMHHCFELVAVTHGQMTVTCDSVEYELCEGEAVLLFPNRIHSFYTKNESRHTLCLFSPNLVSAYVNSVKGKLPENCFFKTDKYLVERLCNIVNGQSSVIEIKGVLYLFAEAFHSNAVYVDSDTKPESLLYRIFRFIDANYKENCSLTALSQCIGYEYTYLSRYFKSNVGMSYNDYVNNYRISRACYLLSNNNMTILEIACECGFVSLRSFNRNFKELIGHSPSKYRKRE